MYSLSWNCVACPSFKLQSVKSLWSLFGVSRSCCGTPTWIKALRQKPYAKTGPWEFSLTSCYGSWCFSTLDGRFARNDLRSPSAWVAQLRTKRAAPVRVFSPFVLAKHCETRLELHGQVLLAKWFHAKRPVFFCTCETPTFQGLREPKLCKRGWDSTAGSARSEYVTQRRTWHALPFDNRRVLKTCFFVIAMYRELPLQDRCTQCDISKANWRSMTEHRHCNLRASESPCRSDGWLAYSSRSLHARNHYFRII